MSLPPWRQKSNQPAYTPVEVKRSFARPSHKSTSSNSTSISNPTNTTTTATTSSTSSSSPMNASGLPDSLKKFVSEAFDQVLPADKDLMEIQLREIVTDSYVKGTAWTTDWTKASVPILEQRRLEKEALEQKKVKKVKNVVSGSGSGGLLNNIKNSKNGNANSNSSVAGSSIGLHGLSIGKKVKKDTQTVASKNKNLNETDLLREKRLKRFESNNKPTPSPPIPSLSDYDPNVPIIGRSTQLEKKYLRLTSAADPNTVRPLHVLQQTLELLKKKWKAEQNYSYICDQFKSLRQDLTVQHIQNEFTVKVYEIHARIAIEKGDLGEYNQCQSQLKLLYDKGIKGHESEFLAYRILYILHTRNRADMNELYFQIESMRTSSSTSNNASSDQSSELDPAIQHALDVNAALSTRNYHKFFQLYIHAPNMGGYIMDIFCDRERLAALATICKAFRPQVEASFLVQELGFLDVAEMKEFCAKYGIGDFLEHEVKKVQASAQPVTDSETECGSNNATDGDKGKDGKKDGSSNTGDDHDTNAQREDINVLVLKTKESYPIVEGHRMAAFKKIDIKGQI